MALKTSDQKRIKKPSEFEIKTLIDMCVENDCTMETLIDAIHSNVCSEPISVQVEFLKTGRLPGEY
jgi:hypothetical protein